MNNRNTLTSHRKNKNRPPTIGGLFQNEYNLRLTDLESIYFYKNWKGFE